jgi:hypothetical protein
MYFIQHRFICRPSDSIVSEDVGIEPRTVATLALAITCSNHSARSHPQRVLDLTGCNLRCTACTHVQSLPICSHIFERRGTGRGRVQVCVVLHLIGGAKTI